MLEDPRLRNDCTDAREPGIVRCACARAVAQLFVAAPEREPEQGVAWIGLDRALEGRGSRLVLESAHA